ncbi:MAG: SUF system NifU family Fe-S cluster assembly protein [Mycoplasmataceae bacterium]|jgi:nitrogen fixation NifU-like protein|nr:SUF system NifU family Fe-S cluster assembly protein [Mycoplasmataceae bacterium]
MSSKSLDIRREIILDHYENPTTKVADTYKVSKLYTKAHRDSPSCIDNLTAYVQVNKHQVKDVKFSGIGCAIATASTDMMANLIKNKNLLQANKLINNYLAMIDGKKYNRKQLGDLYVFENLNKQLNRIKCGKVGIEAIQMALNKNEK